MEVDISHKFRDREYRGLIDYPILLDWLNDNCSGDVFVDNNKPLVFIFEIESDALLFKLTWC